MKKIFVYVGSGRGELSNTLGYINKVLKRVKELFLSDDLIIDVFTPKNTSIEQCTGCVSCFTSGVCSLDKRDSMPLLKDRMLSADIIIFGSPIYGVNVSGYTKVFFDRISYWLHLFALRGKAGLFVYTSCGNGTYFSLVYADVIMRMLGMHIIKAFNVDVFNPEQLQTDEAILASIEETAKLLYQYLSGKKKVKSSKSLELSFKVMKQYIESLEGSNSSEYSYWKKSGMLECKTFKDVLNMVKDK